MSPVNKINRRFLESIFFLLALSLFIAIYFTLSKPIGAILIGITIIVLIFMQFFIHTTLGLLVRYPRLYHRLQKYPIVREDQVIRLLKKTESQIHRILYDFSKVWVMSPLVIIVKNSYLYVNSKIMDKIIVDVQQYQQSSAISREDLLKKMKKYAQFKTKTEMDVIIDRILKIIETE